MGAIVNNVTAKPSDAPPGVKPMLATCLGNMYVARRNATCNYCLFPPLYNIALYSLSLTEDTSMSRGMIGLLSFLPPCCCCDVWG